MTRSEGEQEKRWPLITIRCKITLRYVGDRSLAIELHAVVFKSFAIEETKRSVARCSPFSRVYFIFIMHFYLTLTISRIVLRFLLLFFIFFPFLSICRKFDFLWEFLY